MGPNTAHLHLCHDGHLCLLLHLSPAMPPPASPDLLSALESRDDQDTHLSHSPASLAVNEAANPLTYLHSAGRLLLLHHVAAHTCEDFPVGEVGAVQGLHVGV